MSQGRFIKVNQSLLEEEAASVSPINRGMMYGDGCFETFRAYSGKFLGWNHHFERLKNGLEYLGMELPFSEELLKKSVDDLLAKNRHSEGDAMVRLQCWREGGRGYATGSSSSNWMIQTSEIGGYSSSRSLATVSTRCIPDVALSRKFKLSNGLNYIQAAREAKAQNADDALMLTTDEKISETTSANIFWVKEETVFTPGEDCDLLPGVTRFMVLDVCREIGIKVKEGRFPLSEILNAEAVFCTNSLIEIQAVVIINGKEYDTNHRILNSLKSGFEEYKKRHFSS